MSYYCSHLSFPASDVTYVENSFFREVRSECHNSSSVFSHRSDESSMNNFSPHSDSSSSEQPSYPEQSFSSAYGKFQNSASPYQSSPEEVNRSDIIIENILKRSPIQLGELTDLSNALFSNEGKILHESSTVIKGTISNSGFIANLDNYLSFITVSFEHARVSWISID